MSDDFDFVLQESEDAPRRFAQKISVILYETCHFFEDRAELLACDLKKDTYLKEMFL